MIRHWTQYPGGHDADPGYVTAHVFLNCRTFVVHCDPDGNNVRYGHFFNKSGKLVRMSSQQMNLWQESIERLTRCHAANNQAAA